MTQKITELRRIEASDVWTFLNEVQKSIQEGFVLSDKNEHFPFMIIGQLSATLVKYEVEEVKQPEVKTPEAPKEQKEPTPEEAEKAEFEKSVAEQEGAAVANKPKRGRKAAA